MLLYVLAGCAAEVGAPAEPTPFDAVEIWTGPMGQCEAEAPGVRYLRLPKPEVEYLCESGRAAGCFVQDMGAADADPGPALVLWDSPDAPRDLVAHELAHWLYSCSGLGASRANHHEELFNDTIQGMSY